MKSIATAAVVIAATALTPAVGSLTAHAAGGAVCSPSKQTIEEFSADRHRVKIKCGTIKNGVARGKLPISGEGDSLSPWFATTGKYYYGQYKEAWNWQLGSPTHEFKG